MKDFIYLNLKESKENNPQGISLCGFFCNNFKEFKKE